MITNNLKTYKLASFTSHLFRFLTLLVIISVNAKALVISDTITGHILDSTGAPIPNALVSIRPVSVPDGRVLQRANSNGYFRFVSSGTYDSYEISALRIGYSPSKPRVVQRSAQDGFRNIEITLLTLAQEMAKFEIVARRPSVKRRLNDALGDRTDLKGQHILSSEDGITEWMRRITMLNILRDEEGRPVFSIGTLNNEQNNVTLNGSTLLGNALPSLLEMRASVNAIQYDVSRGQFSGVQVDFRSLEMSTAFTHPSRRIAFTTTGPWLQSGSGTISGVGAPYSRFKLSLSDSRPIIYGKLLSVFAADIGRNSRPAQSIFSDSFRLSDLGFSPDSILRFSHISELIGLPSQVNSSGRQFNDELVGLWELKYKKSEDFFAGIRFNGQFGKSTNIGASPYSTRSYLSKSNTGSGGIAININVTPVSGFNHTFNTYLAQQYIATSPYLSIPSAIVRVSDLLEPGDSLSPVSVNTIYTGGNQSSNNSRQILWETNHSTSWMSWNGKHRLRLSSMIRFDQIKTSSISNENGTFTFLSLNDLENNNPSSFTRTLSPAKQLAAKSWSAALALGDSWRPTGNLHIMYGLRSDISYLPIGKYDKTFTNAFETPTDKLVDNHISPRIGMLIRPSNTKYGSLQLGIGNYKSAASLSTAMSLRNRRGFSNTLLNLECAGYGIAPIPDWNRFLENNSNIPTTCLDSSGTVTSPQQSGIPSVAYLSKQYRSPDLWRSSISWSTNWSNTDNIPFEKRNTLKRITNGGIRISAMHSFGSNQSGFINRNIIPNPAFQLANESNRFVYVPSNSISSSSGITSIINARINPLFSQVFEHRSDLKYKSTQLSINLNHSLDFKTHTLSGYTSYTISNTRQEQYGNNKNADIFSSAWSKSSEPTHRIRTGFDYSSAIKNSVYYTLSLQGTLNSGSKYTPLVLGDINGDGLYNDRAYVPKTSEASNIARALNQTIATLNSRARNCIESQRGNVAERNSCTSTWNGELDLYGSILLGKPSKTFMFLRGATIEFSARNLLAGLDGIINRNSPKGWGGGIWTDPYLMSVRGFDSIQNQFIYDINSKFGAASGTGNSYRTPFSAVFSISVPLSTYKNYQAQQLYKFATEKDSAKAFDKVRNYLAVGDPDPFRVILRLADTILLTSKQIESVQNIQDDYLSRRDSILDISTEELIKLAKYHKNTSDEQRSNILNRKYRETYDILYNFTGHRLLHLSHSLYPDQIELLPYWIREKLARIRDTPIK